MAIYEYEHEMEYKITPEIMIYELLKIKNDISDSLRFLKVKL
jgi:hypothetical protein